MNELDDRRDRGNREELGWRIANALHKDGSLEPMEGLHLNRVSRPTERVHGVSKLAFCVIAQGGKEIHLGDKSYPYDQDHYLLATVELPVIGRIMDATEERPYLSLRLDLEPALVASVMVEAGLPAPPGHGDAKAVVVSALDSGLRDATVRLLRLLDRPAEARVLAPMVKREIVFRLLTGEQGGRLRHLPSLGGHTHRIAQAVERLRQEFDRPLRIESLAKELGMSSSGFHHHFKAVTDMSPLQFQKQMRLQEARRLLLGESLDAASAGYKVGYDDASHFSRDYKRYFGESPIRDVERLRAMAGRGLRRGFRLGAVAPTPSSATLRFGCPPWIRTTINRSRDCCPALRRAGSAPRRRDYTLTTPFEASHKVKSAIPPSFLPHPKTIRPKIA